MASISALALQHQVNSSPAITVIPPRATISIADSATGIPAPPGIALMLSLADSQQEGLQLIDRRWVQVRLR